MSAPVVPPGAAAVSVSDGAVWPPPLSAWEQLTASASAGGAAAKGSWKLARIRLTAACALPSASCNSCTVHVSYAVWIVPSRTTWVLGYHWDGQRFMSVPGTCI